MIRRDGAGSGSCNAAFSATRRTGLRRERAGLVPARNGRGLRDAVFFVGFFFAGFADGLRRTGFRTADFRETLAGAFRVAESERLRVRTGFLTLVIFFAIMTRGRTLIVRAPGTVGV